MPLRGSLLSTSLLSFFKRLASPAVSAMGQLDGVEDDLEKLKTTLAALLLDAEQRTVEGELQALWLRQLQDLALDAEDVVDEFEYEELRRRVGSSGGKGGSSRAGRGEVSDQPSSSRSPHTVAFLREMSRRIDDIRRRVGEISKAKAELDLSGMLDIEGDLQHDVGRRMEKTGLFSAMPDVFGRAEDKEKLIGLLLGTAGVSSLVQQAVQPTGLSVVSIVGMGGLGKTTLAQWVYNNREVGECFHLRMWVWVSQDFDVKRVTRQILEHVVDPKSGLQSNEDLDVLQQSLVEGLKGKRFLLVLDDVWEEDQSNWCEFCAPLTEGQKGSKILITTRNAIVADISQSVKIKLDALPHNDCLSIFRRHAFPGGDYNKHPNLDSIGEEIVKKVKGIPLAARTVGGLLRFESEETKWRDVLQSELWESEEGEGRILPALSVSYEYLPPRLKRCFAYCSVFPKGYGFETLELVQLWMAQGYVQPQEEKAVEDVGRHCLNELVSRSLIQFAKDKHVVHDLLHDLGQLILQHDYNEIKGDEVHKFPEDAVHFKRHLLLRYEKSTMGEVEVLYEFRRLHTFLMKVSVSTNKVLLHIPIDLSNTMICLRVLNLSHCGIESLPDSIDCLKHLRFLALRKTPIRWLPESLCSLYKLQTLILGECDQLNTLPEGMSNLISLHYLEARPELVCKIAGIGKLTCLQNLQLLSVSEGNGNKIGDLKDMNQLRGKLCIQNLHRVESREEAIGAALENKHYLETLEMEWAGGRDGDQIDNCLEESIIECLQPPPNLKELAVKCYAGVSLPRWMSNSSISGLEFIHLHRCRDLNPLPTALLSLTLQDVRLKALPHSLCHLPLQKLVICEIPELRELPLLPATLKELAVESVGLEALPEFYRGHGLLAATSGGFDEDGGTDSREPSLTILKIHGCPRLKTLNKGLLQHHLRHLRVLSIKDCKELVSWPEGKGFLSTLCSLEEELSIEECHKVEPLPEGSKLPTSLKKLTMKMCLGIPNESVFSQLHMINCDDVDLEKFYCHLEYCSYEMLQNIKTVNWLSIKYLNSSAIASPIVFAVHDREQTLSWTLEDNYLSAKVVLLVMNKDGGHSSDLLSTTLGGHAWTSTLRMLSLDGIPERAFLGLQNSPSHDSSSEREENEGGDEAKPEQLHYHPFRFPSLEKLWMWRCRELRRLPTETMLCHMTSLKELMISDCAELTLSSLLEGIRSIPSLEALFVNKCPQLVMPSSSSPSDHNSGNECAMLSSPPVTLLRYLFIDDVRLLAQLLLVNMDHGGDSSNNNGRLFRDHFTSLLFLRIDACECTFLGGEVEECLRVLAPSLQCLSLINCPNLGGLPADLRRLLPNLKALCIERCPEVRCLPDRGLPPSLQLLRINKCPRLAEWCGPLPLAIVHVPLIAIDETFVRGSFPRFLGLKARWDFHSFLS